MASSFGMRERMDFLQADFPTLSEKETVLNHVLRKYSIATSRKPFDLVGFFSDRDYWDIAEHTNVPRIVVQAIVERFLRELYFFLSFLEENSITWEHDLTKFTRKMQVLLYRYYRMTRAFNYRRAKQNMATMHQIFARANFWPKITTQLAVVIFITDRKSSRPDALLQKNIQTMCSCSAYAFHGARNRIEQILNISL